MLSMLREISFCCDSSVGIGIGIGIGIGNGIGLSVDRVCPVLLHGSPNF